MKRLAALTLALLSFTAFAAEPQKADPLEERLSKLPAIAKGLLTEGDVDQLVAAAKGALQGKTVEVPKDLQKRIEQKGEQLKSEITPLMELLIEEMGKAAKEALRDINAADTPAKRTPTANRI